MASNLLKHLCDSFSTIVPMQAFDEYSKGNSISESDKDYIDKLYEALRDTTSFTESRQDKSKKVRKLEDDFETLDILQKATGFNFFDNQERYRGLKIQEASEMVYEKLAPILSDISLVVSGKEISKDRAKELCHFTIALSNASVAYRESFRRYLAA